MDTRLFIIDASGFTTKREAHAVMRDVFLGYEYYGSNLDALYDVLTSIRRRAEIRVHGLDASKAQIGDYAERLRALFLDAAAHNPHLTFVFTEPSDEA